MSDDEDDIGGWDADLGDGSESEAENPPDMEESDIEEEVQPKKQCSETDSGTCRSLEAGAVIAGSVDDPMTGTNFQDSQDRRDSLKKNAKQMRSEKTTRVKGFMDENDLTAKKNVEWTKNVKYLSPNITWHQKEIPPQEYELESPMIFFQKYFTLELLQLMVDNTNLYAVQKQKKFAPTTVLEMKTFVGIHIVMGNCHYPRIRCYWQPHLKIPLVSDNMTVNRFFQLRQNLHFVNIEQKPDNNDRFWKIRPLYETIRTRCLSLPLETDLCIDEQMIPFKGSLNVKQYIKNKPTKWGVKLFALCGRSGTLYVFILYQGSTTELIHGHSEIFGLGGAVVTKLVNRFTAPNFRLYYDNYFSNYNLLQYLRNKYIFASGTARIDRFCNPPFSSDKSMKQKGRGSFEEVISKDGIIMTKWFDNKSVVMASNYKGVGVPDVCKRWEKATKEYKQVQRPEVVRDYNASMGGVDKLDFLITLYRTFIRSRKWPLRMFTHAIDLTCSNAWIEYREKATNLGIPKKNILDLLGFRAYIAKALIICEKPQIKKKGRPSSCVSPSQSNSTTTASVNSRAITEVRPIRDVQFDQIGHFPEFDNRNFASRCKNLECKGQSRVKCVKCNVHLCLNKNNNCFLNYHVK